MCSVCVCSVSNPPSASLSDSCVTPLHKAIKLAERETSPLTDRNPKDFILFKTGRFTPTALSSDNDGAGDGRHHALI